MLGGYTNVTVHYTSSRSIYRRTFVTHKTTILTGQDSDALAKSRLAALSGAVSSSACVDHRDIQQPKPNHSEYLNCTTACIQPNYMHPFLCFRCDQGYFGLGRRRHKPHAPEGREILQEETPKAPIHPGEEDPQEERG